MRSHRWRRPLAAAGLGVLAYHVGPAASWLPQVRALIPTLAGEGRPDHVALTFDDGPSASTTGSVLAGLEHVGVRATFFVLGAAVRANPSLTAEIVEAGHELAIHGWDHGVLFGRGRRRVRDELARASDQVAEVWGRKPVWFRPAYGVLTGSAVAASWELGLRPVLWTAWGRDWMRGATATSVVEEIGAGLRGGATLLLHDARPLGTQQDPGVTAALDAIPRLAARAKDAGLRVGPLAEHGRPTRPRAWWSPSSP